MASKPDRAYQICTNCVMDTSDAAIEFDARGVCDHCRDFYSNVEPKWTADENGERSLKKLVDEIKRDGTGRNFDCILGLSGGIDSSYMLHLAVREFGLRPLVFHVDGGWNTEVAVHNISVMVEKLGLELFTEVINWEEMREFQLAFFRAGVPHIDIPQDHAFIATLYHFAEKHRIKHILNGGNIATECVRNPLEWLYYGTDMAQIRDIRRQFCKSALPTFPFSSIFRHKLFLPYIKMIRVVRPLNFKRFRKLDAIQLLSAEYGWRPYAQKHFESRFTRFFEGYWLPTRFGFDTRRVQFSSLILTKQMARNEALELLASPALSANEVAQEFAYVAAKLGISEDELRGYLMAEKKYYWDYSNQQRTFRLGASILKFIGMERAIKR